MTIFLRRTILYEKGVVCVVAVIPTNDVGEYYDDGILSM